MTGLVAFLVVLGLVAAPGFASAATGDVGIQDQSFTGATTPTADKPQSKLWFTDGKWWANMFDPTSKTWHIFSLDRQNQTWVDSKVQVDTRVNTSSDTLWDGQYLFIGTHVVRTGTNSSSTSAPMRLYRYTYDSGTKKFVLSSGFPKTISQNSSESLTIDKDSTGTVWATWTKVTGSTSQVFLNTGSSNGSTWGTPFVMPTSGGNSSVNPNIAVDDISTLVAFGKNRIGVMWSNQADNTVYWSIHNDGNALTTWVGGTAARGSKVPDDHLNIKSIQADTSGRVFAAVKTSLDHLSGHSPSDPQINLLSFKPGTGAGTWSSTTFGRISDCHTRPQVMLDEAHGNLYVFATGKRGDGTCNTSTGDGAIWMKSTTIASPAFATGSGTLIMRDAASENLNNVTTTKQSASSQSGIIALASNNVTKRYWHADVVPGTSSGDTTPPSAPTGVTATADSATQVTVNWTASTDDTGVASYQVTRGTTVVASAVSGTSTSFVDTTVSPSTTYSYTVSAVDAAGNRSAESSAASVTTPAPAGDTTAPTVPGNVTATADSATQVTVDWTASTDATGVASYRVTRGSTVVASAVPATSTSFVDTTVSPSTTYSYTVSAVDAAGNRSAESAPVSVTTPAGPPPTGTGITLVGTSTDGNSAAVTDVTLTKPTGAVAGDVLVAQITTDVQPTISAAPSGWTRVASQTATGAHLFAYSHVVGSGDGSTYSWTLSTGVKWNGGIAAYRGVNTTTPWDTTPAGTASNTAAATSLTVPGVTTVTAGAMIVGGVALNSGSIGVTPPSTWTEALEATGVQVTEVANRLQQASGAAGSATWTFSSSVYATGWMGALRPAG